MCLLIFISSFTGLLMPGWTVLKTHTGFTSLTTQIAQCNTILRTHAHTHTHTHTHALTHTDARGASHFILEDDIIYSTTVETIKRHNVYMTSND